MTDQRPLACFPNDNGGSGRSWPLVTVFWTICASRALLGREASMRRRQVFQLGVDP